MLRGTLFFCLCIAPVLLYPHGRTEFDVQIGGAPAGCAPWVGPGIYYGVWFTNPYDYYSWCQARYYGPNVQIWYGPGWYGGTWFDTEYEWEGWRRDRGYYRKDGYYHHHHH
jgi:hypothetical protein